MPQKVMTEFDIIELARGCQTVVRDDVIVGSGDDCAVLRVPQGRQLAVSIDTMVEGRHFSKGLAPEHLGYKLLAVNLSDLAAMGAVPAWATVALTLPDSDKAWVEGFMAGFGELQSQFNVALVGGDVTRGPLTATCQIHGFIEPGRAVCRTGAKIDDLIYVTNTLGSAALAVQKDCPTIPKEPLWRPAPRINEALQIKSFVSAMIDLSDGLLADLGHICASSGVRAELDADKIPVDSIVYEHLSLSSALELACTGGDDYELCFTVDEASAALHSAVLQTIGAHCIGHIKAGEGVSLMQLNNEILFKSSGYAHF